MMAMSPLSRSPLVRIDLPALTTNNGFIRVISSPIHTLGQPALGMASYRIYRLNPEGQFLDAVDLDCTNDEEAIEKACALFAKDISELWEGSRLVHRFPADN